MEVIFKTLVNFVLSALLLGAFYLLGGTLAAPLRDSELLSLVMAAFVKWLFTMVTGLPLALLGGVLVGLPLAWLAARAEPGSQKRRAAYVERLNAPLAACVAYPINLMTTWAALWLGPAFLSWFPRWGFGTTLAWGFLMATILQLTSMWVTYEEGKKKKKAQPTVTTFEFLPGVTFTKVPGGFIAQGPSQREVYFSDAEYTALRNREARGPQNERWRVV